jgi:hypothetical protein
MMRLFNDQKPYPQSLASAMVCSQRNEQQLGTHFSAGASNRTTFREVFGAASSVANRLGDMASAEYEQPLGSPRAVTLSAINSAEDRANAVVFLLGHDSRFLLGSAC